MDRSAVLCLSALVGVLCTVPLAAQRAAAERFPLFDVALGATMSVPADVNQPPKCTELGLPCNTPRTFPDFGLVLQGAVQPVRYVALVVEGSLYQNAWDTVGANKALTNHVSAIVAGPRLTTDTRVLQFYKDTTRFRAFAQMLVGPEKSTVLPTRFAIQPGAGLDGKLSWSQAWVRIAYDYRFTRGSPRNLSTSRLLCALVFSDPAATLPR
jgi:hypothetical protein